MHHEEDPWLRIPRSDEPVADCDAAENEVGEGQESLE